MRNLACPTRGQPGESPFSLKFDNSLRSCRSSDQEREVIDVVVETNRSAPLFVRGFGNDARAQYEVRIR